MQSSSSSRESTPSPVLQQRRPPHAHKGKGKAPQPFPSTLTSSPMERIVRPIRTVLAPDTYLHPQPQNVGPSRLPEQDHSYWQPMAPPHQLPPPQVELQQPVPTYSHRPLTALDALAPPDPWGPYAQTPSPMQFQQQPQAAAEPMPQPTTATPAMLHLPQLNLLPAGPLPPNASWSMPSDPINRQHGPKVPDALLRHIEGVDTVEDMNAPFPFMFAQERQCGSVSPVFISQNGHMHYYAWGDYRNVAMLTMTVPVHRLQHLRMNLDAIDRDEVPAAEPASAPLRPKKEKPHATSGAARKRKSRAKAKPTT